MGVSEDPNADINQLNRRGRRFYMKKRHQPEVDWPDITRGLSNHEKMLLKKIGRGGRETKSRAQRNKAK